MKNITNIEMKKNKKNYKNKKKKKKKTAFVCILGFIFHGVSRAKAGLHNKYMI